MSHSLSRRELLQSVGIAAAAGAATQIASPQAPPRETPAAIGPGPVAITPRVNGAERKLEIEPRVTLLDALRERLDLTGAKKVCDRGSCGACTVLVNGAPQYACMVLAAECAGDSIETIEGLAPEGDFHPVSRAFAECDALQCGFCTPGFVMTITHHLRTEKSPTLETVRAACKGNLCRCGTYTKVFEAALLAATRAAGGGR